MTEDHDEKLVQEWYETKTAMMVDILDEEHDIVMHALIPYRSNLDLDGSSLR